MQKAGKTKGTENPRTDEDNLKTRCRRQEEIQAWNSQELRKAEARETTNLTIRARSGSTSPPVSRASDDFCSEHQIHTRQGRGKFSSHLTELLTANCAKTRIIRTDNGNKTCFFKCLFFRPRISRTRSLHRELCHPSRHAATPQMKPLKTRVQMVSWPVPIRRGGNL